MKHRALIWILLLLLTACTTQTVEAPRVPQTPTVTQAPTASTQTVRPTEAPTAVPTPEPTPESTTEPTTDPFSAHFSDEPIYGERSYRSSSVAVSIETHEVDETYGEHVVFHVADIYVRDVTSIKAEAARGDFNMRYTRLVKEIADDAGALLAIDGDTYTHVKQSFVIRNGELYRKTLIDRTDLCVLYRDGRMETKPWGTFTMQEIIDSDPWQVWGFGPALLDENGKSMEIQHHLNGRAPRAVIGYYEPGHYCFVIVDGRGESSGITLVALSRLMEDLGCKAAYNLDGGGSAQMYWNGEIISEICNENRTISDIIYLLPEP